MLRQLLRKWGRPPIPWIESLPASAATPGYRVAEVYMGWRLLQSPHQRRKQVTAAAHWRRALIAPHLDLLCRHLFGEGNRVAFYTALLMGRDHPGFRFLAGQSSPQVDYVMASLHLEAETDEDGYFEKIHALRDAGHKIFLRYVGHPARLHRLDELADRSPMTSTSVECPPICRQSAMRRCSISNSMTRISTGSN